MWVRPLTQLVWLGLVQLTSKKEEVSWIVCRPNKMGGDGPKPNPIYIA